MKPTARTYVATWIGLVLLSALTLGVSFVPLGGVGIAVALAIATAKFALVALFFMHLVETRSTDAFALATALVLVVLFVGLTAADPATRRPGVRREDPTRMPIQPPAATHVEP